MTEDERLSIIEQLALVTNYSKAYYHRLTDEELKKEMERIYG